MNKSKLEYLWLDGYEPTANIRSKTKIVDNFSGKLDDCPLWSFDGSSTRQADGGSSDCLLKPVAIFPDPGRTGDSYLVMTEVLNADGTPHVSNGRSTIDDDDNDFWFGFEQEYFLYDTETNLPLGFPRDQTPQGQFYCSAGAQNAFGREMIERHIDLCIEAGLNIEGINAEVAAGQWEFQLFSKGAKEAGDQMWVARYMLNRLGEEYGLAIEYHPKPLGATDWNGSGMHANFSNTTLRTCGSKETYEKICEAFRPVVDEHIAVYGADNDQRLTGDHETQSITEFSYGVSDRGASIRIPIMTVEKGWKGWLEDRRPASNGDPYKIAGRIIKTVKSAKV
jgi:glutamine synthetase